MDKKQIQRIKTVEESGREVVKGNIFDDFLLDFHRAFKLTLEEKYPDIKKYLIVDNEVSEPEFNRLEKQVISDAEEVSSRLQKYVEEYREIVEDAGVKREFIDYVENIKSFLQIVVNYFVTEDKDAYSKKLNELGLDIRHILTVLSRNFKEQ